MTSRATGALLWGRGHLNTLFFCQNGREPHEPISLAGREANRAVIEQECASPPAMDAIAGRFPGAGGRPLRQRREVGLQKSEFRIQNTEYRGQQSVVSSQ